MTELDSNMLCCLGEGLCGAGVNTAVCQHHQPQLPGGSLSPWPGWGDAAGHEGGWRPQGPHKCPQACGQQPSPGEHINIDMMIMVREYLTENLAHSANVNLYFLPRSKAKIKAVHSSRRSNRCRSSILILRFFAKFFTACGCNTMLL